MSEKYIKVSDIGKVCDPWKDHDVHQYTAEEIAKSIEAIPIEWIEKYKNKIHWEDEQAVIEDMVDRWRKENEDTCMQL